MYQLYVVLGFFLVECFIVTLLMIPGRVGRFIQKPIAKLMSQNTVRKVLWVLVVVFAFLVFEAWQEMKHREREDADFHEKKHSDMAQAMLMKSMRFRAERNFYLTFFTAALFLIMIRMKYMVAYINDLETQTAPTKTNSKTKKDN